MAGGYMGKMLFVDLTTGAMKEQELSETVARDFIGLAGLGARVLFDTMKPGADPLGPENVLGFVTGPLNGSGAYFGGRFAVVCKSPVSGGINESNAGGHFGPELKRSGFDAVFFTGAARKPVYLWIQDSKAELRDASGIWGRDCRETEAALAQMTGEPNMRAAVIGPAGEGLSPMAGVMTDGHRAAARGGPGAVMGSKQLKAIAVRGTLQVPVANPSRVSRLNRTIAGLIRTGAKAQQFSQLGTGGNTGNSIRIGDAPARNWQAVSATAFEEETTKKLSSQYFDPLYKVNSYTCAQCIMACGALYRVEGGKWPLQETSRPEYGMVSAFGMLCLNSDLEAIFKCNDIVNRCGLDGISTGATVAWAMECYDRGILTSDDLDGIQLTWGNADAIVALTQKIADREGCGRILALGSAGAARKWGKGSEHVMATRGIEYAQHDPRNAPGLARTYQLDPAPGRHTKGGLGMAQISANRMKYNCSGTGFPDLKATASREIWESCGVCEFIGMAMPPDGIAGLLSAVTGWNFLGQEEFKTGLRILTMRQAFNVREGLKPSDFTLPPRVIGEPPLPEGPTKGVTVDARLLADNFFTAAGWDKETGKPRREALEMLGGLDGVTDALYGPAAG